MIGSNIINHNLVFKHSHRGFSLLELFVTMAIMSILMAVAIPMYQNKVRVGRRIDATMTLMDIEQQQEIYRNNHLAYGNLAQVWHGKSITPRGYYKLNITAPSEVGYRVTATAIADQKKDKQGDTDCSTLTVNVNKLTTTRSPSICW